MYPVIIILLTYARTDYALRTIAAARQHLRYPDLRWYVADDGSTEEHVGAVRAALEGVELIGGHSARLGYGANANRAQETVRKYSPITLWLEDDWELRQDLDLYRYVCLLGERNELGMVRLGYLNLNMRGAVFGHGGALYWQLDREADPYVFTGHPSLRHQRFRDSYGLYPEGLNPGETELGMALKFRQGRGPGIVWPAALGESGPFAHIGTEKSY